MHFNSDKTPIVLHTTFMKKNWIERLVGLYKLVIFMHKGGWSDGRETSLKYYFGTSFVPDWSFIFGSEMWLEILRLI